MNDSQKIKDLSEIIPQTTTFFYDQFGDAYAMITLHLHYEVYRIREHKFKEILTTWILDKDLLPSNERISQLQLICEAKAREASKFYTLYNRVAWQGEAILIDLCDDEHQVAKITKDKWIITTLTEPLFKRYNHMRPLQIQEGTYSDYKSFLDLMNFNDQDKRLIAVYIASCWIPGIPHTILIPTGAQGSAKSTAMKLIKSIIDNSIVPVLTLPNTKAELVQQLQHNYFANYDNCSEIQKWQSDNICRASTGEGLTKRELYTDDEDRIYSYMRCTAMNGINLPATEPDLLDRAILCTLERIEPKNRLEEIEVYNKYEQLAPKVRGYLLSTISQALKNIDNVRNELKGKLPRMADFTVWGEAIARAMNYEPMEFMKLYDENRSKQNKEAIASSIVGTLLLDYLAESEDWQNKNFLRITPNLLYSELKAKAGIYDLKAIRFPAAPNKLTQRLNTIKANLAELGIKFEKGREDKARFYEFSKSTVMTVSTVIDRLLSENDAHDDDDDTSKQALEK